MKKIKIALLLIVLFISQTYSQDYNFNVASIPENLKEDVNSVILFEDISIEIKSQNSMLITYKKAVSVLNKLGDANKYVTVYYDKNRKIRNIKTIIYNSGGVEIKKVKSKEYKDVSQFDGFSLYSDNRIYYYEHVPIDYPYTIYSEYEIETINTGFIPSWEPIESYLTSIVSSTYKLKTNDDLRVRINERNFDGFLISKNNNSINLEYKLLNFEGVENEPYSPILENFTPKVLVGLNKFSLEGVNGEANNWKEFGKWRYDNLYNGNDNLSEPIKTQIRKLVENITNPIEKAKVIYNYVQNKTRYISIQEGIGGWKPIKAEDVHNLGYGDCKGLTNYTKTLLDVVGVKSHYSVVWAGEEKKNVNPDFFSMQGNHVILNLPNDSGDIWLECTSQKVPFGHLGDFTDDRDVLVITPEGGVIKHTKIYKTEENLQTTKGSYTIDNEGNITADVYFESTGTQYDDNLLGNDGKNQKELDIIFKKYLSNINNIKFSKIEVFNNKEAFKFEEKLAFTATNYGVLNGNQLLVPMNAFNNGSDAPARIRDRKLPFEISRSFLDIDEVKIALPTLLKIEYIPEKVALNTKFGTYSIEVIKIDDYNFHFKRTLKIISGNYQKEDYEPYRNFRKEIAKHDNSKIILIK
ncbi:MAG: hypothetical protein A3F91_08120 [Flavobacteria bacterium RIFCSPLOWO2_12_FULL_35_11]|nr:MAG: hypothetical protein A3F91_08120 [Flavobacteria bacterium RIFCSPLOWO2_12_FULL_35_11]